MSSAVNQGAEELGSMGSGDEDVAWEQGSKGAGEHGGGGEANCEMRIAKGEERIAKGK